MVELIHCFAGSGRASWESSVILSLSLISRPPPRKEVPRESYNISDTVPQSHITQTPTRMEVPRESNHISDTVPHSHITQLLLGWKCLVRVTITVKLSLVRVIISVSYHTTPTRMEVPRESHHISDTVPQSHITQLLLGWKCLVRVTITVKLSLLSHSPPPRTSWSGFWID